MELMWIYFCKFANQIRLSNDGANLRDSRAGFQMRMPFCQFRLSFQIQSTV